MSKNIKISSDQRSFAAGKVAEFLSSRGELGASEGEIKNCITSALRLSVFPRADFGKILFTARVKKVSGRYYLMGTGPDKPKEEKRTKDQSITKTTLKDGQSVVLKGDLVVTITGSGHDFKSKAMKVIVFLSVVVLVIVTNPFGYW